MTKLVGIVVCGVMLMIVRDGCAADPVTPIGTLLINPTALHRKVLKLEGTARNVAAYSANNQTVCGADFELEDETGKIVVLYHVRCQAGEQRAVVVRETMHLIVDGYMEAPPTVMRGPEDKVNEFKIYAHTVTPVTK